MTATFLVEQRLSPRSDDAGSTPPSRVLPATDVPVGAGGALLAPSEPSCAPPTGATLPRNYFAGCIFPPAPVTPLPVERPPVGAATLADVVKAWCGL